MQTEENTKSSQNPSAASAANAVIDTMYNITHDTAVADAYSVSTCSKGAYGVDEGLIFSFPTRTVRNAGCVMKKFFN